VLGDKVDSTDGLSEEPSYGSAKITQITARKLHMKAQRNKKGQLSLTNPRDACEKFARFT